MIPTLAPTLEFGIAGKGLVHTDADSFGVDTKVRMVKEAGVFRMASRRMIARERRCR
jgi:hypothetical protein